MKSYVDVDYIIEVEGGCFDNFDCESFLFLCVYIFEKGKY